MYEFFSEFERRFNKDLGEFELVKRKRPSVIIPTPILKADLDDERWAYQMLMMFTAFRNHAEVMLHPKYRDLDTPRPYDYTDEELYLQAHPHMSIAEVVERESDCDTSDDYDDNEQEVGQVVQTQTITNIVGLPSEDELHVGEIERLVTSHDNNFANSVPRPRPEVYTSAVELLKSVIGCVAEGWWPDKYIDTMGILEAIEGYMKQAFVDSATLPTVDDAMARLRTMGLDEQDHLCVEELMTKFSAEYNLKLTNGLVDDHTRFFFTNPTYKRNITDFTKRCTAKHDVALPAQEQTGLTDSTSQALRATAPEELLTVLRTTRQDIVCNTGSYSIAPKLFKVRQKAVLLVVIDTIEDILRGECAEQSFDPKTARHCRLLLQGEGGTGKTTVLREVVELCCTFLSPNAVRVFAPTAQAVKPYETCRCPTSTFHRVWSKNVGYPGADDYYVQNQGDLTNAKLNEWLLSMKDVKVLICDEMSMLSPSDIELMSRRLNKGRCPRTVLVRASIVTSVYYTSSMKEKVQIGQRLQSTRRVISTEFL